MREFPHSRDRKGHSSWYPLTSDDSKKVLFGELPKLDKVRSKVLRVRDSESTNSFSRFCEKFSWFRITRRKRYFGKLSTISWCVRRVVPNQEIFRKISKNYLWIKNKELVVIFSRFKRLYKTRKSNYIAIAKYKNFCASTSTTTGTSTFV